MYYDADINFEFYTTNLERYKSYVQWIRKSSDHRA